MDWVLIIVGTQVIKKKRPVRPVFPDYLSVSYNYDYIHCHAHSLSLSVKDVTKNTLRNTMGTAEEITILIKYSSKQENILGSIKEQIECENDSDFHTNNLLKLSETR